MNYCVPIRIHDWHFNDFNSEEEKKKLVERRNDTNMQIRELECVSVQTGADADDDKMMKKKKKKLKKRRN